MTLRSYQFYDPLDQLIAKENSTCKGCKFLDRVWQQNFCTKKPNIPEVKLHRCKLYTEKGNA